MGTRTGNRKRAALCALAITLPASATALGDELDPINAAAGAQTWNWVDQGVALRLTQILPDQVRGFYQARGFRPADAEWLAQNGCVFQTVFRNNMAGETAQIHLEDWRLEVDGERRGLRLEENWQTEWQRRGVAKRARLAFRWALFPTRQRFAPGDWNMGMTLYGLRPGANFDLRFHWRSGTEAHKGRIRDLRCARDDSVSPQ